MSIGFPARHAGAAHSGFSHVQQDMTTKRNMVGLVAYRRPKPQTDANASCGWETV
ncbi:hypothetical protein Misp02_29080 [Microtetraspora sp. NBRC 16547]|nr:hypothetical protein Misp02_29080 [Microtetraspora sp. NBRC 16547]